MSFHPNKSFDRPSRLPKISWRPYGECSIDSAMTDVQLDEALRPLYDRPAATSVETINNLTDTLFVSKSSQSRVEVFQPLPTKGGHLDKSAKSGTGSSDIQSGPSLSATSQIVSGILRLEHEKQIQEYAEANRFQVYIVRQRNSYSPLSISSELFQVVSRFCDAPYSFNDYFLYFGDRESEIEIAPPPLRFGPIRSANGASKGIRTECTYCVRFVDTNNRIDVLEPSSRWSLRQTAVFCGSNVEKQESSWIFINLSQNTQKCLQSLWMNSAQPGQIRPLHFHYAVYSIAIANWRPYTIALHTEIEQHAVQLLGVSPDNKGPLDMSDSGERQKLLILENKILTAQLAVNATRDDVATLHRLITDSPDSESKYSHSERITLMNCFSEQLRELEVSSLRLGQLHARLQGITNLVSSFLDLSNGFALQELAKESRRENEEMRKLSERMHELAEKNTQDAAAVTVLTILTLIYLPVTVLSNFFSTSFVGMAPSSSHIFVTKDWWILLATSLPLTALTLYVWWIWMRIKAYSIYPWWWSVGNFMFKHQDR
jgi:hypothetical protein